MTMEATTQQNKPLYAGTINWIWDADDKEWNGRAGKYMFNVSKSSKGVIVFEAETEFYREIEGGTFQNGIWAAEAHAMGDQK